MTIQKILAGTSVAALLAFSSPVLALSLSTDVYGNTSAGAQTSSGSSNGTAGAGATVSVGATGNVSSLSASGNTNTDTSADVNMEPITITQVEVAANGTAGVSTKPASSVSTHTDLSSFVTAQVAGDNNVTSVNTSATSVAIVYKQPAHLFGFIPVTVDVMTTVDGGGQVSVDYPWYSFLLSTNKDMLRVTLQDRVDTIINGDVSGGTTSTAVNGSASTNVVANAIVHASGTFSSNEQARIIAEMRAVLQSELNASLNANASGDASVQ